jgi:hypothetical protein
MSSKRQVTSSAKGRYWAKNAVSGRTVADPRQVTSTAGLGSLRRDRSRRQRGALFLAAEVDEAGDFAAQVLAMDDEVDEAVLLEELAALEAIG